MIRSGSLRDEGVALFPGRCPPRAEKIGKRSVPALPYSGNLENADRWSERTQAGSLCYIVFRTVERSLQSHPSGYSPAPGVARRRRNVA